MSMLPKEQVLPPRRPKALLLFALPVPLLAVILGKLVGGQLIGAATAALSFGAFCVGANLVRRGLVQELNIGERRHLARRPPPLKLIGAVVVAATTAITAFTLGGSGLFESIGFGVGALAGSVLFYGLDRAPVTNARKMTEPDAVKALAHAEDRVLAIEAANGSIHNAELTERLNRITGRARDVLDLLAEQPDKLRRARKFMSTYLDGAERVAVGYAKTHNRSNSQELEDNFRHVLVTIEDVFAEQHSKLLEDEVLDLDVQIEVLKTQLEREGVS